MAVDHTAAIDHVWWLTIQRLLIMYGVHTTIDHTAVVAIDRILGRGKIRNTGVIGNKLDNQIFERLAIQKLGKPESASYYL